MKKNYKHRCYRCNILQDYQGYCKCCKEEIIQEEIAESEIIKDDIYD